MIKVVLGIDPSYSSSGIVAWDGKAVRYSKILVFTPGPQRLLRASKRFAATLDNLSGTWPSLAVIEDAAYAAPNRVVVGKLKELTAIFKLVLEGVDLDYLEVSPTLLKRWVTGSGKAEKHVVANELKKRYGIVFEDDKGFDLSDAAALAVWGWQKRFG